MANRMMDGPVHLQAASVRNNAQFYIDATEHLNRSLERDARSDSVDIGIPFPETAYNVPIIRDEKELVRRAEIWLSAEGRFAAIEAGLQRPYTVLPLPNRPIKPEEIVEAWADTRSDHPDGILSWRSASIGPRFPLFTSDEQPFGQGIRRPSSEHVKSLAQWPANVLSGFDEAEYEDLANYTLDESSFDFIYDRAVRFVAIEIAGEEPRLGTGTEELAALQGLRKQHPRIRSASLFEAAVLNHKYSRGTPYNYPNGFNDTFARAVELEELVGEFEDMPAAFIGEDGAARIGGVHNGAIAPLRRAVG